MTWTKHLCARKFLTSMTLTSVNNGMIILKQNNSILWNFRLDFTRLYYINACSCEFWIFSAKIREISISEKTNLIAHWVWRFFLYEVHSKRSLWGWKIVIDINQLPAVDPLGGHHERLNERPEPTIDKRNQIWKLQLFWKLGTSIFLNCDKTGVSCG